MEIKKINEQFSQVFNEEDKEENLRYATFHDVVFYPEDIESIENGKDKILKRFGRPYGYTVRLHCTNGELWADLTENGEDYVKGDQKLDIKKACNKIYFDFGDSEQGRYVRVNFWITVKGQEDIVDVDGNKLKPGDRFVYAAYGAGAGGVYLDIDTVKKVTSKSVVGEKGSFRWDKVCKIGDK